MRSTKIKNFSSSSLCTCLHHMVILKTRNKITDFLMILAWASPFKIDAKPTEETNSELGDSDINIRATDKVLTRRRKRTPYKWKKNNRKEKRNKGLEYISAKGKKTKARAIKQCPCKCNYKCNDIFTEDERSHLFAVYWGTGDYERQRDFLSNYIDRIPKRSTTITVHANNHSKRQYRPTNIYFLPNEGERRRVCKAFFMCTLDVGESTVRYAAKKRTIGTSDRRGKHTPKNKIAEDDRNIIRAHIRSFPTVDSHYCRKTTSRKYLESGLSIRKMYSLYTEMCREKTQKAHKYHLYETIFSTETAIRNPRIKCINLIYKKFSFRQEEMF